MKKKDRKTTKTNMNLWSKPYIYVIIIALLNMLVFSKTTTFEFVNMDDGVLIYENPLVIDANIPYSEAFKSKSYSAHYKPITFLSWKYQFNKWGDSPASFHTVNWILHVLNSILVFFISIKLFKVAFKERKSVLLSAFLVALLFSINPLRIESVAWATERKDVLFGFFFLLSWLSYIYFIESRKYLFIILGSALYLLSGLSKSMGITLIMVLFITDWWFSQKITLKSVAEKAPYFISFVGLIFLFGVFKVNQGEAAIAINEVAEQSNKLTSLDLINNLPVALQWLLSASLRFLLWIAHSLIPISLSISYSADAIFGSFSYGVFILPLLIVGLLYYAWKTKNSTPIILFCLLFYGITLSPILTFTESGQGVFLSDRYTYIPSIGIFFMLVFLFNKWNTTNFKKYAAIGGLIAFHLFVSLNNVGNWKNSETLFTQALKVNPTSAVGHLNLGLYYREENEFDKALNIYNKGIQANPNYPKLYTNRGKIYFNQNNIEDALKDFNKSISLFPNEPSTLSNRGVCYAMKKNWDKCYADLDRALELSPNNFNTLSNRASAYFAQENWEASKNDYIAYLKLNPNEPEINNALGAAYSRLGDSPNAIISYSNAISLNPNNGMYYLNRSYAYYTNGDKANALGDAQSAQMLGQQVGADYMQVLK